MLLAEPRHRIWGGHSTWPTGAVAHRAKGLVLSGAELVQETLHLSTVLAIEVGHHRQGQGLLELAPGPLQIVKFDQGRSVVEVPFDRRISRNGGIEQRSDPVLPPSQDPGNIEVPHCQTV